MEAARQNVVVVGAGLVGLASALYLLRGGHNVTVIDREPPLDGSSYRHACSFGNACTVTPQSVVPVATPGIAWRVPGMLFNPLGPLAIRWSSLAALAPWLIRFLASSSQADVERISTALSMLLSRADAAWRPLMAEADAEDLIAAHGVLYLYRSDAARAASDRDAEFRSRHGVRLDRVTADEICDLEPNLPPLYRGGLWFRDAYVISSPERLARLLARAILARGGRFARGEVQDLRVDEGGVTLAAGEEKLAADRVVIAAGAWSRTLAKQAGDRVRLDTERGYHVMFPEGRGLLTRPVCYTEHGFYMTPMADGLRAAGTVELGGLKAPLNRKRTEMIRTAVRTLMPAAGEGTSEWMGFRPSMPDSLPVIGRSPRSDRVIHAFGHGHLGLTMAGITGQLVADLVANGTPCIDLSAFRADRF